MLRRIGIGHRILRSISHLSVTSGLPALRPFLSMPIQPQLTATQFSGPGLVCGIGFALELKPDDTAHSASIA